MDTLPSNSDLQIVKNISVKAAVDYRITQDAKYGNRIAYMVFRSPSTDLHIKISWEVQRFSHHSTVIPLPAILPLTTLCTPDS